MNRQDHLDHERVGALLRDIYYCLEVRLAVDVIKRKSREPKGWRRACKSVSWLKNHLDNLYFTVPGNRLPSPYYGGHPFEVSDDHKAMLDLLEQRILLLGELLNGQVSAPCLDMYLRLEHDFNRCKPQLLKLI